MTPRFIALVPAAGSGSRIGAERPKQYLKLHGRAILQHTLDVLLSVPALSSIHVVLSPDDAWFAELAMHAHPKLNVLHCGGNSRAETVSNGLQALADVLDADDWILVHDAARPCLQAADVTRLIDMLQSDPVGGLLALPVADTLKRADSNGRVDATVARDGLWRAQTPQMFRYGILSQALAQPGAEITDEASAIEALGLAPKLVMGSERNIKVTYAHDLALAEGWLAEDRSADR